MCVASKAVMLAQPWKSRLSQSFRPVSLKLDDDTVVSVGFLAQRDLSSSAIAVSCLAVVAQEARTENTRHLSSVGLCLAYGTWILFPCVGAYKLVPALWAVESRGCSRGCSHEALQGPGSALRSCWGWCTGRAEASLGCVRVSNPEVEVIGKVSTGQKRDCSPKIRGDPNISYNSEYDNLCFKNDCLG